MCVVLEKHMCFSKIIGYPVGTAFNPSEALPSMRLAWQVTVGKITL